ncbi:hypothetical protein [Pararhizobium sp. O133]|uniref:hypothetical protein n=1 Tax=Pararhizobium sp. O133 TaxID=3449278 RepID=UPI003F684006
MNQKIDIKFEKSPFFRVVHAEGVWGGTSPAGYVRMAITNDGHSIPTFNELEVDDNGQPVGPELLSRADSRITRQVECELVMDLGTATAMYGWLEQKIFELGALQGLSDQDIESVVKARRLRT